MLTWVIVKARIDSSLNLYEHCVACDDENNRPAGRALRPTLRDSLLPLPCVRLALYTAFRGVKTPRKAVYSHILSPKMVSGSAQGAFIPAQMCSKGKTCAFWRILGVFWLYPGKRPVWGLLWPILRQFLASTWPPAGQQGSFGPQNGVRAALAIFGDKLDVHRFSRCFNTSTSGVQRKSSTG